MARKIDPKPGDKHNMLTYVGDEGREPSAVMCGKQLYTRLGRWKCDCGKEIVCRNRYVVNGTKKSCGCLLRARGEAWHRGKRRRTQPRPKTVRLLVTIQVLDSGPGDMVQYGPESPSRAGKETK